MPLDIAMGIFIWLGVSQAFGVEPSWLLAAVSVAAALLPDLDVPLLYFFPSLSRYIGTHRSALHFPPFYVPVVIVTAVVAGVVWASAVFLGVLWHFLHDTMFLGWGVAWLAPFSKRKWKLFPVYGSDIHWREGLVSWRPEEEAEKRALWLPSHWTDRTWIREFYLRPHFVGWHEYALLAAAAALLVIHIAYRQ